MKTHIHHVLLSSILIILSSCATVASFDSPNNIDNMKGTLYLKDGRSTTGYLTINTEHKKNDKVSIQTANYSRPQSFKLKNVKGYSIGSDHFLLKQIDNNTIIIEKGNSLLEQLLTKKKYFFMKRLTPEDSRIHLFENDYLRVPKENSSTPPSRMVEYYVQLPYDNTNTVYAIDGNKLVPHFESKMSALVSDCPTLADKIRQKQLGYFYAPISLPILSQNNTIRTTNSIHTNTAVTRDEYASILLHIINEYNQCK